MYLKRYNEGVSHEDIEYFCETSLAYLLDEGVVVRVDNYDRSEEEVTINFYDKMTWNDCKDQVIPFLIRLTRKYELGDFGTYNNKNNFTFCVKETSGRVVPLRADLLVSCDELEDIEQKFSKKWGGELIMDKIIFYVKSEK